MSEFQARDKIIIYLFIIVTTLYNCRSNSDHSTYPNPNVSDIFREGYNLKDMEQLRDLIPLLNDSLVKRPFPNWYTTFIFINESHRTVDWILQRETNEIPSGVPDDIFFQISLRDSVLYINDVKSSISDIIELGHQYIYTDTARLKRFSNKRHIPFFGDIDKSRISAMINVKSNKDRALTIEQWRLLFDTFEKLILLKEQERNSVSLNKWNVPYEQLSFEKKIAVNEYVNFSITTIIE